MAAMNVADEPDEDAQIPAGSGVLTPVSADDR